MVTDFIQPQTAFAVISSCVQGMSIRVYYKIDKKVKTPEIEKYHWDLFCPLRCPILMKERKQKTDAYQYVCLRRNA